MNNTKEEIRHQQERIVRKFERTSWNKMEHREKERLARKRANVFELQRQIQHIHSGMIGMGRSELERQGKREYTEISD